LELREVAHRDQLAYVTLVGIFERDVGLVREHRTRQRRLARLPGAGEREYGEPFGESAQ
jgi:hypothetical protein